MPPFGSLADNDIAKFLRRRQAALGQNRVSELLVPGSRLAAHLTGRVHGVLRLDGVDNIRHGDVQLCELIWFYPHPHRVLACSEDLSLADSIGARDGIVQIDVCVVGQKLRVASAVRRVNGDQHQWRGGRLLCGYTITIDLGRELTGRQLLARLREDEVHVGICLEIEIGKQVGGRIAGRIYRVHVDLQIVHAIDLLLDRRSDRLFQRVRVRTDIGWPASGSQAGRCSGNCAIGRVTVMTTPTITVRIAITMATIGRLMKKSDIGLDSSCVVVSRR